MPTQLQAEVLSLAHQSLAHQSLQKYGMVTNVRNWPPDRVEAFITTAKEFPGLEVDTFEEEHEDRLTGELSLHPKVRIRGFTDSDPGNPLGSFYQRWETETDPYPEFVSPELATMLGEFEARIREEWGLPVSG